MPSIADGELTSMALCWTIERADGAGLALTSHDRPILREGVVHRPAPGMTPAAISRGLGLGASQSEAGGALSADALTDADLATGRWNGARVALSAVDWQAPEAEAVALLGGQLGTVAIKGEEFSADLLGASVRLDEPVCPATSAECRASFGDKQCRVDLAGRTISAFVLSAEGGRLTIDQAVDDQFVLGRLVYLSGANCGLQSVIIAASGSRVEVRDLPRGSILAGDRVELRHGCDKRFATCVSRFQNALNFRGEPHVPGNDLLTRYPGA